MIFMKKEGYYSVSEFMKLGHITKKTIRYYDEHNILKPSYVDPNTRARFYTDADLGRLQQILLLKALGFSLSDIMEMTINDSDVHFMTDSLNLQLKLVEDRIEQLQVVAQTIKETTLQLDRHQNVNWSHMLTLIHDLGMETSMKNQYLNASNISSRINLHSLYSYNKKGWFPWIFDQCGVNEHTNILEVGCGDGSFWNENKEQIPKSLDIVLSDISVGMLRDARRRLQNDNNQFHFQVFDCEKIPYADASFDLVIANHVLFYCENISAACREIARVLKPNGVFLCSTYGQNHMKEISDLVTEFDDRIVLSADKLYERFGKENGTQILSHNFSRISWKQYEDYLFIREAEPLISYILSCHGNQNQFILNHYKEFRIYIQKKIGTGFRITKDAGIFLCKK